MLKNNSINYYKSGTARFVIVLVEALFFSAIMAALSSCACKNDLHESNLKSTKIFHKNSGSNYIFTADKTTGKNND